MHDPIIFGARVGAETADFDRRLYEHLSSIAASSVPFSTHSAEAQMECRATAIVFSMHRLTEAGLISQEVEREVGGERRTFRRITINATQQTTPWPDNLPGNRMASLQRAADAIERRRALVEQERQARVRELLRQERGPRALPSHRRDELDKATLRALGGGIYA